MNFNDIYKQFTKSTKENFPARICTEQNKRESNVFESNVPFLCLVINKKYNNYLNLIILYPYICEESGSFTTFGWLDHYGNVYSNIENSTQLWDEFVVGFKKYEENYTDKSLWENFINVFEEQYED